MILKKFFKAENSHLGDQDDVLSDHLQNSPKFSTEQPIMMMSPHYIPVKKASITSIQKQLSPPVHQLSFSVSSKNIFSSQMGSPISYDLWVQKKSTQQTPTTNRLKTEDIKPPDQQCKINTHAKDLEKILFDLKITTKNNQVHLTKNEFNEVMRFAKVYKDQNQLQKIWDAFHSQNHSQLKIIPFSQLLASFKNPSKQPQSKQYNSQQQNNHKSQKVLQQSSQQQQHNKLYYPGKPNLSIIKQLKNDEQLNKISPIKKKLSSSSISKAEQYRTKLKQSLPNVNSLQEMYNSSKERKIQQKVSSLMEKEMKECTFKPKINQTSRTASNSLYTIQNRSNRESNIIDWEKQQYECQFQPKISKLKRKLSLNRNIDNNISSTAISKSLERIKQAEKQKELKKQFEFRNYLKGENWVKKVQSIKRSAFKVPLLYIDVNYGEGQTERITIFQGDKSEDLALQFCQQHGFDEPTTEVFKEMLEKQIAQLISQIDQEFQKQHK